MRINWESKQPEHGHDYHLFRLRVGGVVVINAFTKRRMGGPDPEEALWSWVINDQKSDRCFWKEGEAKLQCEILLKQMVEELSEYFKKVA